MKVAPKLLKGAANIGKRFFKEKTPKFFKGVQKLALAVGGGTFIEHIAITPNEEATDIVSQIMGMSTGELITFFVSLAIAFIVQFTSKERGAEGPQGDDDGIFPKEDEGNGGNP